MFRGYADRPGERSNKQLANKEKVMKKAYVRPQLVKHGNVETMTQTALQYGPSVPCAA
jgi:hypothetical protein